MSVKRKCFCKWDDCENFRSMILSKAPSCHPWVSPIVRLTFPSGKKSSPSMKSISWKVSICRHLNIDFTNSHIPEGIHIYPHHFPIALLKWRIDNPNVRWSTLLSKIEASSIVRNDFGNQRYIEYTNSMYFFLKKSMCELVIGEEMRFLFHQSPMTTRNEINSYIKQLGRGKHHKSKIKRYIISSSTFTDNFVICAEEKNNDMESTVNTKENATENDSGKAANKHNEHDNTMQIAPILLLSGLGLGLCQSVSYIHNRPTVQPPLIPGVFQLKEYLIRKFHSVQQNKELFCDDQHVKNMAKLLSGYHDVQESFVLSPIHNIIYHPCAGFSSEGVKGECHHFSLHSKSYRNRYCIECKQKRCSILRKR